MARKLHTASPRLLRAFKHAALAGLVAALLPSLAPERPAFAAPIDAPAVHPIMAGLETVATRMSALGTKLQLSSLEWQSLAIGARQLTDPETGAPYRTAKGSPLLHWVFEPLTTGAPGAPAVPAPNAPAPETVLFLGGVHGDELSPLYTSFRVLLELTKEPTRRPQGIRLVYVALVNPDGLHSNYGARKNGNDVDLNANLGSMTPESETRFVIDLIDRYKPSHVISLHGPFGWVDYDGPALEPGAPAAERDHILEWTTRVADAGHGKLALKNEFPVSPGSLGSYGGVQRGLHVMTLELPHALAGWSLVDWDECSEAVFTSLTIRAPKPPAPVLAVASVAPPAAAVSNASIASIASSVPPSAALSLIARAK
jgi:hypothetical protein